MRKTVVIILVYVQFIICFGKEEKTYNNISNLKEGIYVPVESSFSFTVGKNNIAYPTLRPFGVLAVMLPKAILSIEKPSFLEKSIYLDSQKLTLADVIKYLYKINKHQIYLLDKKLDPNDARWKTYKFRCGAAKYSYAFLLQIFISIYNELWAFRLKPADENKYSITYAEFRKNKVYIKVAYYNLYNNKKITGLKPKASQKSIANKIVEDIYITRDYSNCSFEFIINDLQKRLTTHGIKIILKVKGINYVTQQFQCEKVDVISLIRFLLDKGKYKYKNNIDLKIQGKNIIIFETGRKGRRPIQKLDSKKTTVK
jgi:hypothetical protein